MLLLNKWQGMEHTIQKHKVRNEKIEPQFWQHSHGFRDGASFLEWHCGITFCQGGPWEWKVNLATVPLRNGN
jgi:hypothetical protein